MSRIGKLPISIPSGVTVELNGHNISVKGSKGELKRELHPNMKVEIKENEILVSRSDDSKLNKSLHGLTRSLIANMVEGVSNGFTKKLEIVGVGYRANVGGKKLTLSLGYSHPIEYILPEGIEIKFDEENKNILIIEGYDKELVGEVAAQIRSYRKPEPYKGKGIKYIDERIIRKAGKAAAAKAA
ncbi:50S ribosomal protein L6 [Candidatus Peregrinibacteria bacterium]|nr:50S ribosomal protein L6 [Candidatus Peregrinibacteria bacterium]